MRHLSLRFLTAAAVAALSVPAVAAAQDLPEIPAGSDNALRDLVVTANSSPASSGSSLNGLLSSL